MEKLKFKMEHIQAHESRMLRFWGRECKYKWIFLWHWGKKIVFKENNNNNKPTVMKETINLPKLKLLFKKRHSKTNKKISYRPYPEYIENSYNQ